MSVEYNWCADSTCCGLVKVLNEIDEMKEEIFENRRWFHQYPELSFEECGTASKIVSFLKLYGINEIWEGIGRTGVVAMIYGASPGPCIALRADMDGLPVTETADIPFKSKNEGVMHACGHDGHMSGLLAVAKILQSNRGQLKGSVKLIFQPAEERYGGAPEMIKDGCLEGDKGLGPKVDEIYGLHLWTPGKLGEVMCSDGPVMAAVDTIMIDVVGKGGHGAMPHQTVDAIATACHLVTSMQTIVSRNVDPLKAGVVSCCQINGGFAPNVIADKVAICGTVRSFVPDVQRTIQTRLTDICCGIGSAFGAQINLNYINEYPATVNAYPECSKMVRECAEKLVGKAQVVPQMTMGAEDFAFFLNERPGAFFFVGASLPGEARPHHKSVFDFDERALLVSASMLLSIAKAKLL